MDTRRRPSQVAFTFSRRPDPLAPWGHATLLLVADLAATDDGVYVASLSSDELVVAIQRGGGRTIIAARSVVDGGFIFQSEVSGLTHPSLGEHGTELFGTMGGSVVRLVRGTTDELFGAPQPVVANAIFPSLSLDGRTLFVQGERGLAVYERADLGSATFVEVESFTPPPGELTMAHYVPRTREIFGSTYREGDTERRIYRAEVCRDGPCAARPPVDCVGGQRSGDGLHCFRDVPGSFAWGAANDRCAGNGMLATLSSADEVRVADAVRADGMLLWTALNRGINPSCSGPGCRFENLGGEPFLFGDLGFVGVGQNCVALGGSGQVATECVRGYGSLCEVEALPDFVRE